jgi:LDH2 family malate/lactate/ureidoglycolate dehydrogenase
MSETYYFPPESLRNAIYELCRASGSPHEEAELVAEHLVKSDLTGHPSHGVIRIPVYMRMVHGGLVKPGAVPELSMDRGPTVLIDGNHAYGQVAAARAMEVAIERCRAHGVAAVGVTHLGHIGRLADYAVSAARADCIALVFTSCGGTVALVAPFEGSARRMATNPLAMAVPSDREYPVVLDLATSVFAEGKLMVMLDAGRSAPDKTLIDKEGRPTANPADFYEGGALLPLGHNQGHKGYLLNFLVETLAAVLTGGDHIGTAEQTPFDNCTFMIALDVARFRKLSQFKTALEEMIEYLKATPVAEGKEVLYPGELEARREVELLETGIPLAAKTVERIQQELDRYEISMRLTELARPAP